MWAALIAVTLAAGAAVDAGEPVVELIRGGRTTRQSREILGTKVTIAIADAPRGELLSHQVDFEAAFAIFTRVEIAISEEKDTTALSLVNAGATARPVTAPPDLCEVIKTGLDAAKKTKGLLDPALGGQCKGGSWKNVELKIAKGVCTVRFKKPGMKLALTGVAFAWGMDQAVKLLRSFGYQNFSVQAGSNQFLAGKIGDRAWKVSLRGPDDKIFARTEVSDATFSTVDSALDPRTCQPARKAWSATAIAKTAIDGYATAQAAFVLGWAEGQKLGASLVLVDADGGVHFTPELLGVLDWTPPGGFNADAGR